MGRHALTTIESLCAPAGPIAQIHQVHGLTTAASLWLSAAGIPWGYCTRADEYKIVPLYIALLSGCMWVYLLSHITIRTYVASTSLLRTRCCISHDYTAEETK